MYVSELSCIGGLFAFALADPRPAIPPRVHARQNYGYSFPGFLPFPVPTNTGVDPSLLSQSALSTGTPSGTALPSLSQIGTISAPFGNSSLSESTVLTGIPNRTSSGTIDPVGPISASFDPSSLSGSALPTNAGSRTAPGTIFPTSAPFGNYSFSLGQSALSTAFSSGTILGSISPVDPTAASNRNVTLSQPALSTSVPSGTAPLLLGQGSNTAPYGNASLNQSGTAYSTGSVVYSFSFARFTPSGSPSVSSNATRVGLTSGFPAVSSNVILSGTISATPIATNSSDPAASITHGPYPFPSSLFALSGSGIIGTGTGISRSATTRGNFTRTPVPTGSGIIGTGTGTGIFRSTTTERNRSSTFDPTASGIFGTGTGTGIFQSATSFPFPTASGIFPPGFSYPPYPYSFPSFPLPTGSGISASGASATGTRIIGTGTAISVSQTAIIGDPSATITRSRNATIIITSSLSRSAITANLTSKSFDPSASATINNSRNITASTDPSLSESAASGNVTSTPGLTGTGIDPSDPLNTSLLTPITSNDPNSLTALPTTFATSSTAFTFTPTTKTMPTEYYHHHRRPKHHRYREVYDDGYEYQDGDDEEGYEYGAPSYEGDGYSYNLDPADAAAGYAYE